MGVGENLPGHLWGIGPEITRQNVVEDCADSSVSVDERMNAFEFPVKLIGGDVALIVEQLRDQTLDGAWVCSLVTVVEACRNVPPGNIEGRVDHLPENENILDLNPWSNVEPNPIVDPYAVIASSSHADVVLRLRGRLSNAVVDDEVCDVHDYFSSGVRFDGVAMV